MKECPKCKTTTNDFAKSKSKKDGLQTYCKKCEAEYRIKNKDKTKQYMKKYWSDPKNKQKRRNYYKQNPEKFSQYNKNSYERHGENYREINRKNNMKIKEELIIKLGGKCSCCGITILWVLTIDHKKPLLKKKRINTYKFYKLALNSSELRKDLQVMCWGCNTSKNKYKSCKLEHSIYNK